MTKSKASAKKSTVAWGKALLVLLIAAWMFILGVMVGRGTAPVQFDIQALQNELSELRNTVVAKERNAVEKAIRGQDHKASLDFYEALKRDGLDTTVQPPPDGATVPGSKAAEQVDAVSSVPHKPRADLLAKNGKKHGAPKSSGSPSTPSPPSLKGHLTIQVAALQDQSEARRIVANLKREGYSAYLSRVVIPEKGLWFRVRVGSYANEETAAEDMDRLSRARKKPILVEK